MDKASAAPTLPTAPGRLGSPGLLGKVIRWAWRWLKVGLVVAFVSWQLFVLLVRNPLDLWSKEIKGWCKEQSWWGEPVLPGTPVSYRTVFTKVDDVTYYYTHVTGMEQGWSMFTPNLARSAPFLTARIEFTDETSELVKSENEPALTEAENEKYAISYLRIGHARQRKLEDNLLLVPDDLKNDSSLPLYEAFVRWSLRRWQRSHLDDPRTPARVVLLKRRITFPEPGQDPQDYEAPTTKEIGTFDAEGKIQ